MTFSFTLKPDFLAEYHDREVPWGFRDTAGNSVGEIIFLRTYSRKKDDGTKERWWEVCQRVVEGMFSIQKDYVKDARLPWDERKAQRTAQDAYERLFTLKWTPPGRGLWIMGTPLVMEQRNSAALQNCAFVSTSDMTKHDPSGPFTFLMEASMLGIGVGFDTEGADKDFTIYEPREDAEWYTIPDTREGWVESLRMLLDSYLKPGKPEVLFEYSEIRPAGEPIRTFGGTAAGADPLIRLHDAIRALFSGRAGQPLTLVDIADIGNLIGVCVVSGNVRRSAELLMGPLDSDEFLNLKNPEAFPERTEFQTGWSFMSNNSVTVTAGDDLSGIVEGIKRNGEPGVIWLDQAKAYGRMIDDPDGRDYRVKGFNPCAEQSLESYECCTLVETYLNRHDDLEDYKATLKVAYLYAKTVTLLPTHWKKTNAIMQRNRRIGASASGMANFVDAHGLLELRRWLDSGYCYITDLDEIYSDWLCVRPSIKMTTVKPSGTVSILAGESPGVHWAPGARQFFRLVTFNKDDPLVKRYEFAGYRVEESAYTPETSVVVYFPLRSDARRTEREVSIFEKLNLAVEAQRWWSDNAVSVTVSFDPETEGDYIGPVLNMAAGSLKTISFLPMGGVYKQMPFTEASDEEFAEATRWLSKVPMGDIYDNVDSTEAEGEAYCTTDVCLTPTRTEDVESHELAPALAPITPSAWMLAR